MGNPMEHFPSGKGSFCRPGRRRVIFRPRCFHSDAVSPLSIFFQVPTHISQGELSHRGTFFRADRGSGQIFSSRPMFPLRCTGFFPSPAWEIPLKLFSSPKWFFRRASSWQSLLPSRGPSHANTPLPRKTFPSGKEIFLAPMFSLRCMGRTPKDAIFHCFLGELDLFNVFTSEKIASTLFPTLLVHLTQRNRFGDFRRNLDHWAEPVRTTIFDFEQLYQYWYHLIDFFE